MNAKELLAAMGGATVNILQSPEANALVLRALSLLAAAEVNDGTTPETDNPNNIDSWRATKDRSRSLERERNGLARGLADALEENARLKEELAKLRQHAEAMAESIDRTVFSTTAQQDALAAYRADFPEGTK